MQVFTLFMDRNFWAALIIAFLILFAPLMVREWLTLRAEGLYNIEWYTTSMAQLLQRNLSADKSLTAILPRLREDPQTFAQFDRQVQHLIGYMGLLDVKFFDLRGEVIYATDKDLIGKVFLSGTGKKTALAGRVYSELTSQDEYFSKYAKKISADLAEVYIPIVSQQGETVYILEAYYDYAPITQRTYLQLQKSALSLLFTSILVLALLSYLYRSRQQMKRQVKAYEAILPICMYCKKIRIETTDQPDEWMEVESYFARQDNLEFSHGLCDDCLQKHYPASKTAKQKQP